MAKIASPIILRTKCFNTYFNKSFLYFYSNNSYDVSYFKFFNLYINLILLFKNKFSNLFFNNKLYDYLYCQLHSINVKFITIDFVFSRLRSLELIYYVLNFIVNFNLYFNYFIKFKFYGVGFNKFFILNIKFISYYNLLSLITHLKYKFIDYISFKKKLIYTCKRFLNLNYKGRFRVLGIKFMCSGIPISWDKRSKINVFTVGNLLVKTITSKFFYFTDVIKTQKGVFGIKIWLNVE